MVGNLSEELARGDAEGKARVYDTAPADAALMQNTEERLSKLGLTAISYLHQMGVSRAEPSESPERNLRPGIEVSLHPGTLYPGTFW
jgi:hypothetical protein